MRKSKQAVSLIVLVITIIVMIILAGTIILSLDNSGIIGKAQDAVDKTNLNEIKHLAQLAWAEAYLDEAKTDEEFRMAVLNALTEQQITEEDYKGYTLEVTTQGVNFVESGSTDNETPTIAPTLNHSGIIPQGGQYVTGAVWDDTTFSWDESNAITYNAGETFPTTVQQMDIYYYNGQTYVYEAYHAPGAGFWPDDSIDGWFANYHECKLKSINDEPVVSMRGVYQSCVLDEDIVIPENIIYIRDLFASAEIEGHITITINSNPTDYEDCFFGVDMSKITLAGSCTIKQEIANTGDNADQVTIID